MARWQTIFLQLSSLLLLSSCAYQKLNKQNTTGKALLNTEVLQPLIPSNNQSAKYKAEIDVLTKHFTGIVVLKQTDESTSHIVFVTELGMRMFDFVVKGDSVKADFVFDALNKPQFVNMLTSSFRDILLIPVYNKKAEEKSNKLGTYYWLKDRERSFAVWKQAGNFAKHTQVFNGKKKSSQAKYEANYSLVKYKQKGLVKLKINLIKIDETK